MTHWEHCYSINTARRAQSSGMDEVLSGTRSDGIFFTVQKIGWLLCTHSRSPDLQSHTMGICSG